MSASCFLVSMYLIWICGSNLIRSNNQSRATLWVLETCLIVDFFPFMIILITASLSSHTYNKASWCEDWTFERTRSTLSKSLITLRDCLRPWFVWGQTTGLLVLYGSELYFQGLKQSDPTNQEREYRPTSMLHPKKWFLILLNCAKLKSVSRTSKLLEQMYDFHTHNVPSEVDFESSRFPVKSESWNSPSLHCFAVCENVCVDGCMHMCFSSARTWATACVGETVTTAEGSVRWDKHMTTGRNKRCMWGWFVSGFPDTLTHTQTYTITCTILSKKKKRVCFSACYYYFAWPIFEKFQKFEK